MVAILRPPRYILREQEWTLHPHPSIPAPNAKARLFGIAGRATDLTPPDPFLLGFTRPAMADPLNPTPDDNVGWDGTFTATILSGSAGVVSGVYIIPDNTTVKDLVFLVDVRYGGQNARANNCLFLGGPPNTSRPWLVWMPNGGYMERCSVVGLSTSMAYYKNGVRLDGGVGYMTRNVVWRTVDCLRKGGGRWESQGNFYGMSAFFNNDGDQNNGDPPNWGHADGMQKTAPGTGQDVFIGDYFLRVCDVTGVTWSGGAWGQGSAARGTAPTAHPTSKPTALTPIGMPEVMLNSTGTASLPAPNGFKNSVLFPTGIDTYVHGGLYCNGVIATAGAGHSTRLDRCWLEGGNNPSALIQYTSATGTTNILEYVDCRFGIGGFWTGAARFLVSFPSGTPVGQIIRSNNTFADFPSCQARGIVGQLVTDTSGGSRYTGSMLP